MTFIGKRIGSYPFLGKALGGTNSGEGDFTPPVDPDPTDFRLLTIGHSLADNPLTLFLNVFFEGVNDTAERQTIIGAPLHWNWTYHDDASVLGIDGRLRLATEPGITDLILTEGGPYSSNYVANDTCQYVQLWRGAGLTAQPNMKTWLNHVWYARDYLGASPTDLDLWATRSRNDYDIYRYTIWRMENELGQTGIFRVLPGGNLMANLWTAAKTGWLYGITTEEEFIAVFFSDMIHIHGIGFWAIASMFWALMHREIPNSLPWDMTGQPWPTPMVANLNSNLAFDIHTVVWDTIRELDYTWNLPRPNWAPPITTTQLASIDIRTHAWPDAATVYTFDVNVGAAGPNRVISVMSSWWDTSTQPAFTLGGVAMTITADGFTPGNDSGVTFYGIDVPDAMAGVQTITLTAGNLWNHHLVAHLIRGTRLIMAGATGQNQAFWPTMDKDSIMFAARHGYNDGDVVQIDQTYRDGFIPIQVENAFYNGCMLWGYNPFDRFEQIGFPGGHMRCGVFYAPYIE